MTSEARQDPAAELVIDPASSPPATPGALEAVRPPGERVDCWRCGKGADAAEAVVCPHCRASLRRSAQGAGPASRAGRDGPGGEGDAFGRLIGSYVLLLSTSVIFGIVTRFGTGAVETEGILRERLVVAGVLEGIDTVIVALAIATIARPGWRRPARGRVRVATWLIAGPALAGVLYLNHLYHRIINDFISVERIDPVLVERAGLTWPVIVADCLQPAIVEELFFRYLVLGMLLRVMGATSAVAVSSIMFGLAHVGSPLSIPILTGIGVFLAAARLGSGGLLLPMILHFLHNLLIPYWEGLP